jgi:uncharacterized RDD family membrane protein YckC
MTENSNSTTTQSANSSTLLEFPGVNRNRPAWRKELSERFREIQQRRAREAALEAELSLQIESPPTEREVSGSATSEQKAAETSKQNIAETTKQLGLVPPPDEPEINPIVAAALRRVERARAQTAVSSPARSGSSRAQAATAAARVVEEQPEEFTEIAPTPTRHAESLKAASSAKPSARRAEREDAEGEQARASTLVVVPPTQVPKPEPPTVVQSSSSAPEASAATAPSEKIATPPVVEAKAQAEAAASGAAAARPQPRHLGGVIDEFWLERNGIDPLPKVAAPEVTYDDRAPRAKRMLAALFDLLFVAFLCAPFAAVIELTISNWGDPRVSGSMGGIVLVMMFLYDVCSIALAGRTWGMRLCSLHAVDARTASVPTTWQCVRRAFIYMLSLATLGLGILYSIFDAEGRTAHDILSGTVVVKD